MKLVVDPATSFTGSGWICGDAVLIGSASDTSLIGEVPILAKRPDEKLVLWIDDSDEKALFNPEKDWKFVEAPDNSWKGYNSIKYPLADTAIIPQVSWTLPHSLPSGKYDVYTIIPETFAGLAIYETKLDENVVGVPVTVDSTQLQPLPQFFKLSTVEITDSTKPNILTVSVKPAEAAKDGVLAVDVVLVLKSPE